MIYLTRRERFCAAHKLWNPDWSEEKNEEVFGKCANVNWHGHNYELFVTVRGEVKDETGFILNLKTLSKVVKQLVVDKLDHRNVNLDVDFMKGKMASTENLAIAIWNELVQPVREIGGEMDKIKLVETENNFVEYYGGQTIR